MPQTKSAKKALRKDLRRQRVNNLVRQKARQALKTARQKLAEKNLTEAFRALDRAAKNGVVHKNKASRLKSRLARLLQKNAPTVKTASKKRVKKASSL